MPEATPEMRIAEFLRQHGNCRGIDPEDLYTVFTDAKAEPATLRASDLRSVLRALESATASVVSLSGQCDRLTERCAQMERDHAETVAERDRARDAAVALEQENARLNEHLGKVGAIHNGCLNTQDDVVCPWCRIAELEATEQRVRDACDEAEHGALRWEDPLPVPLWVRRILGALDGEQP